MKYFRLALWPLGAYLIGTLSPEFLLMYAVFMSFVAAFFATFANNRSV